MLSLCSATVSGMVAPVRKAEWNPMGLDVPGFIPAYVKSAPSYLDGSLPGDAGFDPLGLAVYSWPVFMEKGMTTFGEPTPGLLLNLPDLSAERRQQVFDEMTPKERNQAVMWMREAELKHGRLAMLAAIGWPLGELVNWGFLHQYGDLHGRTPSLFNGGLLEVYGPFWFAFLAAASYVELTSIEGGVGVNGDYDLKFDPWSINDKIPKAAEVNNGRLAMLAITGFGVQEFLYGSPVVEQSGFAFGRF